jgi:hypothetical protein
MDNQECNTCCYDKDGLCTLNKMNSCLRNYAYEYWEPKIPTGKQKLTNPNDVIRGGDRYKEIAVKIAEITEQKSKAYGNAFHDTGKFLQFLYPDGVPIEKYGDMLILVRIWDKIRRIATAKDAFGESPYEDIIGYCLLALDKEYKENL